MFATRWAMAPLWFVFMSGLAACDASAGERGPGEGDTGAAGASTAAAMPSMGASGAGAAAGGGPASVGSAAAASASAGAPAAGAGGTAPGAGMAGASAIDSPVMARAGSDPGAAGASGSAAGPADEGWEELVAGDWELAPNQESYQCVRRTLTQDVIVGGFKPIEPLGTHHTLLTAGTPTEADGTKPCSGLLSSGELGLWASGVNSPSFDFPVKVGMRLRKGQQVILNLHLFNVAGEPLRGRSGIAIKRRVASEIEHFAEGTLMGTVAVALPAKQQTHIEGGCTFAGTSTILTMMPHMHQLGRRMKIVAERAGKPELVLHDGEFEFQEQSLVTVPEGTTLDAGDRLRIECWYDNPSDRDVGYGESTMDEMCFAAVARYPESGQPLCVL